MRIEETNNRFWANTYSIHKGRTYKLCIDLLRLKTSSYPTTQHLAITSRIYVYQYKVSSLQTTQTYTLKPRCNLQLPQSLPICLHKRWRATMAILSRLLIPFHKLQRCWKARKSSEHATHGTTKFNSCSLRLDSQSALAIFGDSPVFATKMEEVCLIYISLWADFMESSQPRTKLLNTITWQISARLPRTRPSTFRHGLKLLFRPIF